MVITKTNRKLEAEAWKQWPVSSATLVPCSFLPIEGETWLSSGSCHLLNTWSGNCLSSYFICKMELVIPALQCFVDGRLLCMSRSYFIFWYSINIKYCYYKMPFKVYHTIPLPLFLPPKKFWLLHHPSFSHTTLV